MLKNSYSKYNLDPWNFSSSEFLFSINEYENLLEYLSLSTDTFKEEWINNSKLITKICCKPLVSIDWVWAFYVPLISDIKTYLQSESSPLIVGISGLPGCGKSTFGRVFESIAQDIDIPLNVVSMDDFYLPSPQLDIAMNGNPWNVPRGLPGSHSVREIQESLQRYLDTGLLISPKFDKSLRNGMGDRSGVLKARPKVLILEGWFLGCLSSDHPTFLKDTSKDNLIPPLSEEETSFRETVQANLNNYIPIWEKINKIWHIKARDFSFTSIWKVEQELNLFKTHGSSLSGERLDLFIRMINASIPQNCLQNINSDVVLEINKLRKIVSISTK